MTSSLSLRLRYLLQSQQEALLLTSARHDNAIGRRVTDSRIAAGLSVEQLAEILRVAPDHLRAIEAGADLTTAELDAIAAATSRDLSFFLDADDDVEGVLLRQGAADAAATSGAVEVLARFVRDYEFLRQLDT